MLPRTACTLVLLGLLALGGPTQALAGEAEQATDELPGVDARLRLLGQASLSSYDLSSWLGGGVFVQGLIHGPVWFSAGGGLETRPEEQATTSAGRLAVPLQVGFRFAAQLPGGLEVRGGSDLLVVLESVEQASGESRTLTPRPGGLLETGLSVPLGGPVAFDISVSIGAVRREPSSELPGLPALPGPDPRFQLRLGVRFELGPGSP